MASPGQGPRIIRFGAFELDVQSGELRKQGLKTRLTPQSFQVLLLLLERPGEVVTREQLREALWPADTFVDFEMGVNSAVKKLRDALGDPAENPRFVETLPRRGYRFIAPMEKPAALAQDEPAPASPVEPARAVQERTTRRRTVAVAAVIAVALAAGATWGWRRARAARAAAPIRSVVVLPFENLTGNAEQNYFVDGVTEALTTDLAQIRALKVISRTSAMQYKGARKPLPQIAGELGVDAVVEGAVMRSGERVRVSAQLIDALTDHHLWARSYDRELRDVLGLQSELAQAIAQAVQVEVRPEERRRLSRAAAVHPEAYENYLKGRFYWGLRGRENILKAAGYFQQAIADDPAYAQAYSGLSDVQRGFSVNGVAPPRECMPKAEAAARKALALDDTLAEAHASLAGVLYEYHWDWEGAEREFQRALDLDPNYAEGHRAYAVYLLMVHRNQEALREAERARERSPLSPVINVELAYALARAGRYDEALERLRQTRELDPNFFRLGPTLALTYAQRGDFAKAIAVFEERKARTGHAAAPAGPLLAYLYGVTGRRAEALRALRALEDPSRQQRVGPQGRAIAHLGLGDKAEAVALLERACEERAIDVLYFSGLLFDGLHDDPKYRDLVTRMGLAKAYFPAGS
jgi:TolB-like protein/DNA-binding winged helix-turn-helix (wHTH) protein/Tfp pilus assembly protein PilF